MRFTTIAAIAAASVFVRGDNCAAGGSQYVDDNWYCTAVEAIHYSNVGTPGTYQRVTSMEGGSCTSETKSFAGPISPLDEEVSIHLRGPIALKQFAAYVVAASATTSATSSAAAKTSEHHAGHDHKRFHGRNEKRDGAVMVTATIDGQVDTWVNNYFGPGAQVSSTVAVAAVASKVPAAIPQIADKAATIVAVGIPKESGSTTKNNDEPLDESEFANGTYVRTAYYHSASQKAENITFIGNYGGAGSGVFDENFGASTAYLNSEGTGAASGPQVLNDTLIPSNKEFAIFTGTICSDNDTCGYVRPGSVAYHGFGGADKIFLFEFSMPSDGTQGFNADMPAIWMLNAQIPHTLQYGQADCSCWPPCGEFDIMEVLSSGSVFCKSTLHTNTPGGDSDYIKRPTDSTMKLAVLFHAPTSGIRIQVLPSDYVFSKTLNQTAIDGIMNMSTGASLSEFAIVPST